MPHIESSIYHQFKQKIKQLLKLSTKSKQYEEQLIQYPPDYFIDILYDQNENLDTKKMSSMILKLKLSNKQKNILEKQFNSNAILNRLETIYMMNNHDNKELFKLQNAIQIVIQKILQVYFDDQQKCQLFQSITDKILTQPLFKQQKYLSFLLMLIRSMYYLTMNNQIIIGPIVVYLGELLNNYEKQFIQNQIDINIKIQSQKEIFNVILKCLEIINQIKDIVQINNQEQEDAVKQFMENSSQLRTSLFKILQMKSIQKQKQNPNYVIWSQNSRLNRIKVQALKIWQDVWTYYAQQDLLHLLINSILSIKKSQIIDEIDPLICSCLTLLERSCVHKQYNQLFFNIMQNLTIKLFELISINQSQYGFMQTDPDYFIEIMDDFCKQQHLQLLKTRAGSLLSNLTLAIDGYLSFVTHLSLVSMRNLQTNKQRNQMQQNIWKNVLSIWQLNQQQLIQVSILIVSSLSDQIQKRIDLKNAIYTHLIQMINIFNDPQSQISKRPLIILRYMQLYSFFSFPNCLDHFIKNKRLSNQSIYKKQISKSFETVMQYYDRKNAKMENYINQIANTIMLLGDHLTPLLEQQIMKNNKVLKNFKQKVLQKLIIWFLQAYNKQDILQINKNTTLIIKILEQNLKTQIQDKNYKPFNSTMLKQYFVSLYRLLNHQKNHPCQQAIVEIAISHVQYLYDLQEINQQTIQDFYGISKFITEKNNISLNNALELFNSLICPNVHSNRKGNFNHFKYDHLSFSISLKLLNQIILWLGILFDQIQILTNNNQSIDNTLRQEDLWEVFQLAQICFFNINVRKYSNLEIDQQNLKNISVYSQKIMEYSLNLLKKCKSSTMKMKLTLIILQIIQLNPQIKIGIQFLFSFKFPFVCDLPPYECRKYCYFLMSIFQQYKNQFNSQIRIGIIHIIIDLIYFLQNQKLNLSNYQQKIYMIGDSVSLNAFQKYKKIHNPFDFKINFIEHDQFRTIIQTYPYKEQLNFINEEISYKGKIRDLIDKIIVNNKTRKKITVKRI